MGNKKTNTKRAQAQNGVQQANRTQAAPSSCPAVPHIANDDHSHLNDGASSSDLPMPASFPDASRVEKQEAPLSSEKMHTADMNNKPYTGIYRDAETAARAARFDSLVYVQLQPEAGATEPAANTDGFIYGNRSPVQREKDKILAEIISTNWRDARGAADELLRLYQQFDMVEMYQYLEDHAVSPIVVFELLMRANAAAMSETRRQAAFAMQRKTVYAKKVRPHVLKQFDAYLAPISAGAPQPSYKNKARFIEAMQVEVKLLFPGLPELTPRAISDWLEPRKAEFPPHWPRRKKRSKTQK